MSGNTKVGEEDLAVLREEDVGSWSITARFSNARRELAQWSSPLTSRWMMA